MNRLAMVMVGGLLAFLSVSSFADATLGRLFFTPEQRARMDAARQQERNVRFEEEESTLPPANITLNGVIIRSDGKTTVWINNRVQSDEKSGKSVTVQGRSGAGGQISVITPDAKRPVPLKVGQSIDMSSGQVEEVYRRTPPAPAPGKETPSAATPGAEKSPVPPSRKDDALDTPADVQGEIPPPH